MVPDGAPTPESAYIEVMDEPPDRFTLFVPSEHLKRPCHIVWRKEKRIGVAFD